MLHTQGFVEVAVEIILLIMMKVTILVGEVSKPTNGL